MISAFPEFGFMIKRAAFQFQPGRWKNFAENWLYLPVHSISTTQQKNES